MSVRLPTFEEIKRYSDFRYISGAGQALDLLGDVARQRSAARFWKEWQDAEGLVERFPNLNKWTLSSAGALVTGTAATDPNLGNAIFGTAGPTLRMGIRGIAIPAGASARFMARFSVVNAQVANAGSIGIGVTNRTMTQLIASDFTGTVSVAISLTPTSGTPKTVTFQSEATTDTSSTIPAASDTYLLGVIVDPTNITLFIRADDGSVEARKRYARSGRAFDKLFISNNDSRGVTGCGIGPLGFIRHFGPTPASPYADVVSDQIHLGTTATTSDPFRITLPKTYDARTPPPVLLFTHGLGGDENEVFVHTGLRPMMQAFLDAGFMIASPLAGGDLFNNNTAISKVEELYTYLRDNYALGPIIIAGNSMGGPLAMTLVTRRTVPAISALMCFQSAITHLDEAAATNPSLVSAFVGPTNSLAVAFGYTPISNDAAGSLAMVRDPAFRLLVKDADPLQIAKRSAQFFRGIPVRFYASPADTFIDKTRHADVLAPILAKYNAEATVVTTSGDHNAATQFPATDAVNWAKAKLGMV